MRNYDKTNTARLDQQTIDTHKNNLTSNAVKKEYYHIH